MADASGLREAAQTRWRAAHRYAVNRVAVDLRAAAPYATGELRKSIYSQTLTAGTRLIGEWDAGAPQAGFTNDGTNAHWIVPRGPGYPLRFYWPKGPQGPGVYRFMRVWHPGNRGTKWWDQTLKLATYQRHFRYALGAGS